MKKLIIFVLGLFLLVATFTSVALAKRLLPRARPATSGTAPTRGVSTSVKFRDDRLAIVVTFSNLGVASSVSYILSYNTRGTTQGASGTLNTETSPDPTTRELLFGTCSHGVCRYDYGITNARFVVTTIRRDGIKVVKGFRLKV